MAEALTWRRNQLRREMALFSAILLLGVAFSFFAVNIPGTEIHFDVRWLFGYFGFAVFRKWYQGLVVAIALSLAGPHQVSLLTALIGNMLYAGPILLVVRIVHPQLRRRIPSAIVYGLAWFGLILLSYELFVYPGIFRVVGIVRDAPILATIGEAYTLQPFFVESLIVGAGSALGLIVHRIHGELVANRVELATTLYSIGDGVISTDTAGRIQRMNPVAERLTGYSEFEARGMKLEAVFEIFNEDSGDRVETPVHRVLAQGTVVGLANHTILRARDGTGRPIMDSAAPIAGVDGMVNGVVLVFRDQTAERAAEARIRQAQERLLLALRNAAMGIWDWEIESGRVAWAGEHATLFGISMDEFGGTIDDVQSSVHPDDRDQGMEAFSHAVETGAPFDNTYRVVRPGGEVRWMHSFGRLIRDDHGKPVRIVGTTQDVTENLARQEEIKRALAEKEILLRELYHRTKNNMNVIRSMMVLRAGENPQPEVAHFLRETDRRIHTLSLVHEMLYQTKDLSRIDLGAYLMELAELIVDGYATVGRAAAGGTVSLVNQAEEVPALIDTAVPCGLLVNELVSNAIEHGFPDGREGEIVLSLAKVGDDELRIEVRDNGVGVPEGFDLRDESNVGLRTAVVLVEHQLQGRIEFERNEGLTVRARFPFELYTRRV